MRGWRGSATAAADEFRQPRRLSGGRAASSGANAGTMPYCPGHGAPHEDRRHHRPRLARSRGARADGRGGHGRRAAELLPRHRRAARRDRAARARRGRAAPAARSRSSRTCPGPKLRIGALRDDIVELKPGDRVTFVCGDGDAGSATRGGCRSPGPGWPTRSSPTRSSTSPTARSACASTAVRAGDGEIDAEVEIGGAVASRQGLNIPGRADDAARGARGGPRAPARRRVDRRRPRRAVVRAPRRGRRRIVREHTRLPLIAKIEKPQARRARRGDHPRRRLRDGRARRPRHRAADRGRADRPEAAARARRRSSRARRSPRRRCSTRWSPPRARRAPRSPTSPTRSSTAPTR